MILRRAADRLSSSRLKVSTVSFGFLKQIQFRSVSRRRRRRRSLTVSSAMVRRNRSENIWSLTSASNYFVSVLCSYHLYPCFDCPCGQRYQCNIVNRSSYTFLHIYAQIRLFTLCFHVRNFPLREDDFFFGVTVFVFVFFVHVVVTKEINKYTILFVYTASFRCLFLFDSE